MVQNHEIDAERVIYDIQADTKKFENYIEDNPTEPTAFYHRAIILLSFLSKNLSKILDQSRIVDDFNQISDDFAQYLN